MNKTLTVGGDRWYLDESLPGYRFRKDVGVCRYNEIKDKWAVEIEVLNLVIKGAGSSAREAIADAYAERKE